MDKRYISERDYRVLQYALKAATEPSRITDKDFEEIRKLGFSNIELLEITEAIASAVYQVIYSESLANRLTWLQISAGKFK